MNRADFAALEQIARSFGLMRRQAATDAGLQMIHADILDYLGRADAQADTLRALTAYLGQTKGTVSQSVAWLEKQGYLEKQADAHDRRVQHLRLTPRGDILARRINRAIDRVLAAVTLTGGYAEFLQSLLQDVADQIRRQEAAQGLSLYGDADEAGIR